MNEHGYRDEMPLPTYEEVVGASNHNTGFKGDRLLRPRPTNAPGQDDGALVRQCVGVPTGEVESTSSRCLVRWKHWTKKYLAALVGVIITPLFFLYIILELKSCGSCQRLKEDVESNFVRLDNCNTEVMDISGRYSELYRDLQNVQKEHEELLVNKETADTEVKNLRYQYNTAKSDVVTLLDQVTGLKKEIEEYKILLNSQRDDNTALTKTFMKTTTETTSEITTEATTERYEGFYLPKNLHPNDVTSLKRLQKIFNFSRFRPSTSASPQI